MKVSVIIPTYNEEDVIGECLESLSCQTYKDMEVVVVDDGSTDNSKIKIQNAKLSFDPELKTEGQFKIKNVKFFEQKHQGPGAARNLGASRSKGDILVFVDSDMTFDKDFIKQLVAPIVKGGTKGTFSKEEYVANPDNVWSQCWGINEGWEEGRRHPKNYPDTQKVFRAILKSEFDKVSGFSLTGYTDDWTLSDKLGYQAVNASGAKFYHKNPDSLMEVFKQARWIGKRQYKLGFVGTIIALFRSWLPVSIFVGLVKSLVYLNFYSKGTNCVYFMVFKVFYDMGIFSGALASLLGGTRAK